MGNSVMLNGVEYAGEQIAYKDSTYELVSKVAYLIGVPLRIFENEHEPPKLEIYQQLDKDKNARISVAYEAEAATLKGKFRKKEHRKQTGVFFEKGKGNSIEWNVSTGLAQVYALRFKYMNTTGKPMPVLMKFIDSKGVVLKEDILTFPETPDKWKMMSTTTGTFINAGHYKVLLSAENMEGLAFDALDIQ